MGRADDRAAPGGSAMSQLDIINQRLADLSSTDPNTVRSAYEWLAANARENTRALVAMVEAAKPAPMSGTFLEKVNTLLTQIKSDDAELAKEAQDHFREPGKAEQIAEVLLHEVNGQFGLIYACGETLFEWVKFAKKNNWSITRELKRRTDNTMKAIDAYAEMKEK